MLQKSKLIITGLVTGLMVAAPSLPAVADVSPAAQTAAAKGVQYLSANQQADGSISGFPGVSDWAAEAVKAGGQSPAQFTHGGASLVDFLKGDILAANSPATAIERRIIAAAAAGENPANFGGTDYNSRLAGLHAGGQIGDPALLNDDIFGIIAIDAAHDSSLYPAAQDALDYLLAHQAADGGFSYLTNNCAGCGSDSNDTAAALIAFYAAGDIGLTNPGLATAKTQALTYLLSIQQPNGGFGYDAFSESDGSSTSWSLMALNTIGPIVATQAGQARDWLLQDQNGDGGFAYAAFGTTDSDTSTTADAVTALLGSTWLLRPAANPATQTPPPSSGGGNAGTTPSSPQPVPPAIATTPTPVQAVSQSSEQPDSVTEATDQNTPQVKSAKDIVKLNHPASAIPAKSDGSKQRHVPLGVWLLGLVALVWFVLESLKARRAPK
jgi:hypothetical protein